MPQKIQWHENLTTDEKIAMYKTVLDILECAGGSMDFNDFIKNIYKRINFGELKNQESSSDVLIIIVGLVQELIKRGYIRFELYHVYTSILIGSFIPVINVVRI